MRLGRRSYRVSVLSDLTVITNLLEKSVVLIQTNEHIYRIHELAWRQVPRQNPHTFLGVQQAGIGLLEDCKALIFLKGGTEFQGWIFEFFRLPVKMYSIMYRIFVKDGGRVILVF